jgi:hypothetical protein
VFPVRAIEADGRSRRRAAVFLTSTLVGGEWLILSLHPRETTPVPNEWEGDWEKA